MAVNIGPRIGVEGEEAYRAQMSQIIQQAKTLDSEMKAVTSSFTKNTKEQEKDAATTKVLTAQIENQQKRVQMLTEMVEKSTAATGEDSNATLKWKQALNEAQAELNRLSNAADDAGKKTSIFGDMLKANLAGDLIKSAVSGIADAVRDLASAFGSAITESAAFADEILTTATNTGLSAEQLQEYQYMAELTDTSVETITGSMAKLIRNMNSARDGTGTAAEAFKTLGLSVTDTNGELRSNEEVFSEVVNALGSMQNETERDAASMAIFGRSAQELNSFISAGADDIEAFRQEAHDMGYVLDNETLGALGGLDDGFQRLSLSAETLKHRLGAELAPQIAQLFEVIISAFGGIDWSAGFADSVAQLVSGFASNLLPRALELGSELITGILSGIISALPQLATAAATIIPSFITTLLSPENITLLIDSALQIILALGNGLISALPALIEAIPVIVSSLVIALMSNLPELLRTGVNLIGAVAEGLLAGLSGIISSVARIGDSIVQGFYDLIQNAATWGQDLIQNFINGIASRVGALWDTVKNVAQGIRDFIGFSEPDKGPLSNFHTFAPDMMALFMQGIKDNQAQLQTTFSTAFNFRPLLEAPAAGTNTTNTHNYGGVTVQVYGAPGQDMSTLADEIMYRIQDATARKEAVFR